jgi:uncharacterized protein YcfJ
MITIQRLSILALATASAGACLAQDVGRVISTQPVVQQVSVPQRVCSNQQVEVQQQKSGAGAVMGAIAGGAIGNQVGRGAGNAAATMIGIMGGAILGDHVEGAPPTQLQTVQNCTVQNTLENRTIGYNVVYEFGGKQYSVRMPNDPGPTIALQVSPIGAPSQGLSSAAPQAYQQQPEYIQQAPVVISSQPVYVQPVYAQPVYGPRYYPPVSFNFGYGYWGGGHHHWR